jgi:hypothetical protein
MSACFAQFAGFEDAGRAFAKSAISFGALREVGTAADLMAVCAVRVSHLNANRTLARKNMATHEVLGLHICDELAAFRGVTYCSP